MANKKGKNQSVDEYNNYLDSYAKPLLDKWLEIIIEKNLYHPKQFMDISDAEKR